MEVTIFDPDFAKQFAALPQDEQKQELKDWKGAKNRPDAFPAVQPFGIAPPADSEPEVIGRTWYSERWDDPSWVQCNACRQKEKFFREPGYFVNYPDGRLFIAGPKCGEGAQKARMRRAIDQFRRESIRDWENGALLFYVENFDALRDFYLRTYDAVDTFVRLRQRTQKQIQNFYETLRVIQRDEGRLAVEVRANSDHVYARRSIETQTVGKVDGASFFASKMPGAADIKNAKQKLQVFFGPNATANELMDQLANAEEEDKREELRGYYSDAFDCVERARAAVVDAITFFNEANLSTLFLYGTRPDALRPIRFVFSKRGDRLILISNDDNGRFISFTDDEFKRINAGEFGNRDQDQKEVA